MHGLTKELCGRTIRRVKWAGGRGVWGKKRKYLHEKLYVKRKCIKRNKHENMNLHT